MDSGESVQIERIVRQKRGRPGEEIEVLLSDASSFFAAMKSWQQKPFHEGDVLTDADVTRLRQESSTISTRARALSLLGRADHSRFLLQQKLVSRGCDTQTVSAVLDQLQEAGTLDDARFAASWTRDRVRRHPEGRPMLVAGLRQRGVNSGTAEEVVAAVLAEEQYSPEVSARSLAERFFRARGATAHSVAAKLYRRGFSPGLVREVIGERNDGESADFDE